MNPKFRKLSPLTQRMFAPLRVFIRALFPVGYVRWQYRYLTRPVSFEHPSAIPKSFNSCACSSIPRSIGRPVHRSVGSRLSQRIGLARYLVHYGQYDVSKTLTFPIFAIVRA
jgi:hypothetical protein